MENRMKRSKSEKIAWCMLPP